MTEAASKPVSARMSERLANVTDQAVNGGVNGPVDAPATESLTESVSENVRALAVTAKEAARGVAAAADAQRNEALEAIAQALERAKDAILAANAADVSEAQAAVQRGELARVLVDRLKLSPTKFDAMIAGVRATANACGEPEKTDEELLRGGAASLQTFVTIGEMSGSPGCRSPFAAIRLRSRSPGSRAARPGTGCRSPVWAPG